MRYGRVLSTEASDPVELRWAHWVCSPIWKLSAPHTIGNFLEALSQRLCQLLTPLVAPLPSPENGEWGWRFQGPNCRLVFLVTSPHPRAHEGPCHENKRHSYHAGNCNSLRSSVSETESKIMTNYYLSTHICKSFESSISGTGGRYIYLIYVSYVYISCYFAHAYYILL